MSKTTTTSIDETKLILPITKVIKVLQLIKQYEGANFQNDTVDLMLAKYPELEYMGAFNNNKLNRIKEDLVKNKVEQVRIDAIDLCIMFNDLKKIDGDLKIMENQAKSVPKDKTDYHINLEIQREDVNLKYEAIGRELQALKGSVVLEDPELLKIAKDKQANLADPTNRLKQLEEISALIDINLLDLSITEINEILASIKSLNPFQLN